MNSSSPNHAAAVYDLLVIGAGPAGLSSATTAAEFGLNVLLVDEHAEFGGPMYRSPAADMSEHDAERQRALLRDFDRSATGRASGTAVWWLSRQDDGMVLAGLSHGGEARLVSARQVIAATGALERSVPIPGWTLPGVMPVGLAWQALDRDSFPDGRLVLAGTGPLLYRLVARLATAGREITALIDTTPVGNWRPAAEHALDFVRSGYLPDGIRLLAKQIGVPAFRTVSGLRIEGSERAEGVSFQRRGKDERVACDMAVLHAGTAPDIGLSRMLGCAHRWDRVQLAWIPQTDGWCESSVPGFAVAGDAAGIAGPDGAVARGRLAALAAATRLGALAPSERDRRAEPIRAGLVAADRGRRFIDLLYRPTLPYRVPFAPDTSIDHDGRALAGQIRHAIASGAGTPAEICRYLGGDFGSPDERQLRTATIAEIVAADGGEVPNIDPGLDRAAPCRAITLGELASLDRDAAGR